MENFQDIVKKIVEKTGKKDAEILEMIRIKQKEYNNLISDYGAAYLVAREFGINVEREKKETDLKIKDLFSGINSLRIKAKILQKREPTIFRRSDGSEGKVMNVLIGDETGTCMLVLWDDQVDEFEFEEGESIEIINAYTRERRNGEIEIRLGMYGLIKKNDEEINAVEAPLSSLKKYEKKKIIEILNEGENVEIRGYITKFFYKNPIIYYCRECNETKNNEICEIHGKIDPLIVVSGIFDDETSSIVFNMFGNVLQSFLGLSKEEIIKVIKEKGQDYFYEVLRNTIDVKYRILGVIKHNKYNDTLEIMVNNIKELDVEHEIGVILKEFEDKMEEKGEVHE